MTVAALSLNTPSSVRAEHAELQSELAVAANFRGRLGEAARAVATTLGPHFIKEEKYVLPPLGILPVLAAGKIPHNAEEIRAIAERLEPELEQMTREHRAIVASLKRFAEIAEEEGRTDLVQLAIKVKFHAANEEEVLYPAAVLVGKYLKHVIRPAYTPGTKPLPTPQDPEC